MNFDSRGRLSGEDKVDTTGAVLTSYVSSVTYNIAGQVTGLSSGSGVSENYSYSNDRLQLTRQTATQGATTLMDLTYGYAAAAGTSGMGTTEGNGGQLMSITGTINSASRNQSFTYDNLGRLVTASSWNVSQRSYSYDRWGNRAAMSDSITGASQSITLQPQPGAPLGVPNNQIASVNGTAYTYDQAGNLTNDGAHSYQYDGEGRIATVDNGSGASYFYDTANQRVKKLVGSATTYYVWQGGQVIAEYNSATAGAGNSYYLADRLSNRMITDTNGGFKGTQDPLPFGEDAGTSGTSEKHRFTMYERDAETATDYAINRQYASSAGRFVQADVLSGRISHPKTLNRFAYSYDDPINFYDPDGEIGVVAVGALVVLGSAVTGAVFGAIFPPSGHSRWAGAGIGFLSGGVNGLFAVAGAATGGPAGELAGGFFGGFTSTVINDAFSNEGVSRERAVTVGFIGAATAGTGSIAANKLIAISPTQYRLVYPGISNFLGNLGRLFSPSRGLPLTGNVGRTTANQLAGNAVAAGTSQAAVSITQAAGLDRPFSNGGGPIGQADQLLAVPRPSGIPYGGFFWPSTASTSFGPLNAGQIAVVNVISGTIWINPIMSPVATPIPSPVVFPVP